MSQGWWNSTGTVSGDLTVVVHTVLGLGILLSYLILAQWSALIPAVHMKKLRTREISQPAQPEEAQMENLRNTKFARK